MTWKLSGAGLGLQAQTVPPFYVSVLWPCCLPGTSEMEGFSLAPTASCPVTWTDVVVRGLRVLRDMENEAFPTRCPQEMHVRMRGLGALSVQGRTPETGL